MQINIKNLYIGFLAKYIDCELVGGKYYIDYEKCGDYAFYMQKNNVYYNIFTGKGYEELKVNSSPNSIGVCEPLKYNELFSNRIVEIIENNPLFNKEELLEIANCLSNDSVYSILAAQNLIENRAQ